MGKKRRLADLFVVGKELTLDDGQGDSETVWIQKLSSVQNIEAIRRADARRARVLTAKRLPESDIYQAMLGEVYALGDKDAKLSLLALDKVSSMRPKREAELAADEEWTKDNYLAGLRDTWEGDADTPGLKERYAEDSEDPDAKRVLSELTRFDEAVEVLMVEELEQIKTDFGRSSEEEINNLVVELFLDIQANSEWMDEFSRCQMWKGVRELDDHKKLYFDSRDEVDDLPNEMITILREAFEALTVDVLEGKDLPVALGSSPSSEPVAVEGTTPSSGLVAVSG